MALNEALFVGGYAIVGVGWPAITISFSDPFYTKHHHCWKGRIFLRNHGENDEFVCWVLLEISRKYLRSIGSHFMTVLFPLLEKSSLPHRRHVNVTNLRPKDQEIPPFCPNSLPWPAANSSKFIYWDSTPLKMNGWNLKITTLKSGKSSSKHPPPWLCVPSVNFPGCRWELCCVCFSQSWMKLMAPEAGF